MQHILLITNHTEERDLLENAIDRENCIITGVGNTATDLESQLKVQHADLLVMALDNTGEVGLAQIKRIMTSTPLPIVMFVTRGDRDSAAKATAAGVSAYVVDGLQSERIAPILAAAVTRFKANKALQEELERTQNSLQERKIIERAKGLLMQQRGCSEEEAYASLRKLAMQRNKRLADIASSVIDAATLLH